MTTDPITRRIIQAGGLLLIAHGIAGLLRPRSPSLLARFGPPLTRAVTEELADYPNAGRLISGVEIALGLLLASRQAPVD